VALEKTASGTQKALDEMDPKNLVGIPLTSLKVERLTEVYEIDSDGRYASSKGYFRDVNVAMAYSINQASPEYYRTREVIALTNANRGIILGESIILENDEVVAKRIREQVLGKLSPEERRVVGI
jgi:hypothetical protein